MFVLLNRYCTFVNEVIMFALFYLKFTILYSKLYVTATILATQIAQKIAPANTLTRKDINEVLIGFKLLH